MNRKMEKTGLMIVMLLMSIALMANLPTVQGNNSFSMFASSLTTGWNQTYGGPGVDCFSSIIQTMDGGFAMAGHANSSGAGGFDAWLVQIDEAGNMLWNQTYGGPGSDIACCVVQTTDGGYALAGYTSSFGAGRYDFWLVKTDGVGNMLWNQTYGGTGNDMPGSDIQTSDGGYAMAGSYYSGGFHNLLVKTDELGNMQWNQTYGAGVSVLFSVVQTSDEGYATAGFTYTSAGLNDFLLVKTDAFGNMLWNQIYGGTGNDGAYSMTQTIYGGYTLAGYTDSYGLGDTDFLVVNTDEFGNMLWNQTYGGPGEEQANSIYQRPGGGYLIFGSTTSFGAGNYNSWVVTTDCFGNMYQNETFGGSCDWLADHGIPTEDKGYAFCGTKDSSAEGEMDNGFVVEVPPSEFHIDKKKLANKLYGHEVDLEPLSQNIAGLIPEFQDAFCGPTAAASCLAWFAEAKPEKFGNLIPDWNENKELDIQDKYWVAAQLGFDYMHTKPQGDPDEGTDDVDIFSGLIHYINDQGLGNAFSMIIDWNPTHLAIRKEFNKGEDVLMGLSDGKQGHWVVLRGLNTIEDQDPNKISVMDPTSGGFEDAHMRPKNFTSITGGLAELPDFDCDGDPKTTTFVECMISVSPKADDPPKVQLPLAQSSAISDETLEGYVVVSNDITYVITGTDFGEVYVVDGQVFGVTGGTIYNTTGTVYGYANRTVEIIDGTYFPVTGSAYIINGSETLNMPSRPFHDVAVTDIQPFKTVLGEGYSMSINVTVANEGNQNETFLVTACANATLSQRQTITLRSGKFTTINFTWNSTGFAKGNYTIIVRAWPVHNEIDTEDNNYICDTLIHVGAPGDISSANQGVYDGTVNMRDIAYLILLFNTRPSSTNWKPNADINNDATVNMRDISIAILNFNKHE